MAEMQLAKLKMDGAEMELPELSQLAILSEVIIIESLEKLETTVITQMVKDAKLTAVENFQAGTDQVDQHHRKIFV
jgi:phosphoglycerate dehydrogenase-like enzyme